MLLIYLKNGQGATKMYRSPLDMICSDITTKIIDAQENQVIQVIQNCGINVDKEELIKALMYDRQQYEKGYADARTETRWIPVSERPPHTSGIYNVTREFSDGFECRNISDSCYYDGETWYDDTRINHERRYLTDVVAWMPLPEPYKGETDNDYDRAVEQMEHDTLYEPTYNSEDGSM